MPTSTVSIPQAIAFYRRWFWAHLFFMLTNTTCLVYLLVTGKAFHHPIGIPGAVLAASMLILGARQWVIGRRNLQYLRELQARNRP